MARRRKRRMAKGRTAARRTGGRTAAQRAATRRMIAANRAGRRGKAKARRTARRTGGKRKGRTAAQRAATRKMLAANRRRGGQPKRFRSRRRAASLRRKAGGKSLRAIRTIKSGQRIAGLVRRRNRRNPRGGTIMARRNGRRRRRNPGIDIMGTAKRTIAAAIPAVAGGAIVAIIDAKLLADRSQVVRIVGKVLAAAGAGVLLRSRPDTANIMMGAILGSLGTELGAKLSGGILTPSKAATVQALGTLIREDPGAMSALIDATGSYSSQVPQMSGFESMADVNLG